MRGASVIRDGRSLYLLTCATVLFAGCAGTTTELKLTASAPSTKSKAFSSTPLRVFIAPVQDQRLDAEAIGNVANRAFVAHAVSERIDAALQDGVQKRWMLSPDPESGDLVLHPTLRKCYISGIDVTKAAVIVVEVTYLHRGKAAGSRIYRGRHTSMNWWNSDAELTGALQAAFDDCLAQILGDVDARAKLISVRPPN